MRVYVTKWVLTQGMLEVDGERSSVSPDAFNFKRSEAHMVETAFKGEWYESRDEAVKDAEARREKKIKSLKKNLKQLESLRFE